jgi:hypothetical protein
MWNEHDDLISEASGCRNLEIRRTVSEEMRNASKQRMRVFGAQPVESYLHQIRDLAIAVLHDFVVFGSAASDICPVEGREELDGDGSRKRKRRGEDGVDAERGANEDREHLDAQAVQPQNMCQTLATRDDHNRMVGSVGDHGDNGDLGPQSELHEPVVLSKIDAVALGPRPARLIVPTRVHED